MKYYSYNELGDNDEDIVVTLSEEEIKKTYYPYWYERMCKKFGKEHVDQNYSFNECLDDWIIVNWAWEVKDNVT